MDPLVRGLGVCSGPGVGGGGVQDLFGYHCARLAGSVMGMHAVSVPHSHLSPGDMFQQVHRIVKQALQRYSEDRIGMVDYALESGGVCPAFTTLPYLGSYNG